MDDFWVSRRPLTIDSRTVIRSRRRLIVSLFSSETGADVGVEAVTVGVAVSTPFHKTIWRGVVELGSWERFTETPQLVSMMFGTRIGRGPPVNFFTAPHA
jgi:hypothetical protein